MSVAGSAPVLVVLGITIAHLALVVIRRRIRRRLFDASGRRVPVPVRVVDREGPARDVVADPVLVHVAEVAGGALVSGAGHGAALVVVGDAPSPSGHLVALVRMERSATSTPEIVEWCSGPCWPSRPEARAGRLIERLDALGPPPVAVRRSGFDPVAVADELHRRVGRLDLGPEERMGVTIGAVRVEPWGERIVTVLAVTLDRRRVVDLVADEVVLGVGSPARRRHHSIDPPASCPQRRATGMVGA